MVIKGLEPFDKNDVGNLPLMNLCQRVEKSPEEEVLDLIKHLVEYEKTTEGRTTKPSSWRDKTSNGQTIVFYAAGRKLDLGGSYEILLSLKDAKFSMSDIDSFQQTPLFYAAREHSFESCEFLIRENCSVREMDRNGQTCLYYAVSFQSRKVGPRKYNVKAAKNRMKVINLLVEQGAPLHTKDYQGRTVEDFCPLDDEFVRKYYTAQKGKKRMRPDQVRGDMLVQNRKKYLSEHQVKTAKGHHVYYITYADPGDAQRLSELEDQFVEDHRNILNARFGTKPPFTSTCMALGLNTEHQTRRNIISSIASKADRHARTLKAVDSKTRLPVGYLYFKCNPSGRRNDDKGEKQLEISHLKVDHEHHRRGLAQALFFGVLKHLVNEDMIEFAQDMRLSVFDANAPAIALYERLGFQPLGEPWYSKIKNWPGGEGREIGWRRYNRMRNRSQTVKEVSQMIKSRDEKAEEASTQSEKRKRK